MDDVLISEREGIRKPDPRIFERAPKRLGVKSAKAWYVGDHPEVDIRGAFDAGLTAVWRRTSYWRPPDVPCHQIDAIDELIQILL
jgi:putative hydrolase of the HAD superfamily